MLNSLTRYYLGLMLLIGAITMIFAHDSGMTYPFVLFPTGMIISGLGAFLHGPMDSVPASFRKIPNTEKSGIVLLVAGMVCMLISAALKALL